MAQSLPGLFGVPRRQLLRVIQIKLEQALDHLSALFLLGNKGRMGVEVAVEEFADDPVLGLCLRAKSDEPVRVLAHLLHAAHAALLDLRQRVLQQVRHQAVEEPLQCFVELELGNGVRITALHLVMELSKRR